MLRPARVHLESGPKSRQVETLLCELPPSSEDLVHLVVFAGNSLAGDAGETPVTC